MPDKVVNFNEEKKSREKPAKKIQKSIATLQDDIAWMLDGSDPTKVPHDLRSFPYKYFTTCAKEGERPQIWRHDEFHNTATLTTKDKLAGTIASWMISEKKEGNIIERMLTHEEAKKAVEAWLYSGVTKHRKEPKSIGYKSDPETLVHRLDFDPNMDVRTIEDLQWFAPTWHEIVGRLQNYEGFCGRIGSIMDMEADRKQALWISGPKDSGKSQIAKQLKILAGGAEIGSGAFVTMSDTDLQDKFFKAELIGKRVCVMNEVSATFINSEEFKSITGDDDHRVRPCGGQGFFAKLTPLIFFFSNNPPETQSKAELFERIIYCRINALPEGTELVGQAEYQKLLTDELPSFMGFCEAIYSQYRGKRLPNDSEEMLAVVQEKEAEPASFFAQWFVEEDGASILSHRFEEILKREAPKERNWYRAYIKRNHGKKEKLSQRGDRRWKYVGFRERTISERNHPEMDPVPF